MKVPKGHCWKLLKSCYGLVQAAKDWADELTKSMLQLGFKRLESDKCVYIKRKSANKVCIVAVYVDDCAIFENDPSMYTDLIRGLKAKYKLKELGALRWFLGMLIERTRVRGSFNLPTEVH